MATRFTRIDQHLFGPWALVTGASSGIGREFARQLAANKINVVLAARRLSVLDQVGQDLTSEYGIQCRSVPVDLAGPGFLSAILDATRDLDVGLVVSNAGDMVLGEFLTSDHDALLSEIRLNVESHLGLTHHFGRQLTRRGRGGIVLVSSVAGIQGVPYIANYSATKSYVLNLGEALHHELARHGVQVTVVVPGATNTPMVTRYGADQTAMGRMLMPVETSVRQSLIALNANRSSRIIGRMNRATVALTPRTARTKIFGAMNKSMANRVRSATSGEAFPDKADPLAGAGAAASQPRS